MIKKIILYTVFIALLVSGAVWGFFRYYRWQSFRVEMPAQADRVLRLNLEQIGTKLLTGEKDKAAKDPFFAKVSDAFDIPLNLFAFGVKNVSSSVFYVKIDIASHEKFLAFANEYLPNGADSLRSNAVGNVSVLFNKKEAVILMGKDTAAKVYELANDFLNNKNTIAFSESKLFDIKNSASDLSSYGNMYNFNIDFLHGKIAGTFVSNVQDQVAIGLKVPEKAVLALISNENIFALMNKWGIKHLLPQVETSNLISAANQGFAVFIDGETQQEKSIVSYEYNEDFEKIPVSKLELVAVPNINIKLPLSGENGLSTLRSNSILLANDSVNSAILPLWKIKYQYKANQTLQLYSSPLLDTVIQNPVLLEKDADMLAWVNFDLLSTYESFKDFSPFISKLKNFNVKHESAELYALELTFKDEQTNAIRQLMRMLTTRGK